MTSILHCITTISRGGAETQLVTLAREQVCAGNHVSVVYLKDIPDLRTEFINAGVKVIDSIADRSPIHQVLGLRKLIGENNYDVIHTHLPRAELFYRLTFSVNPFVFSRHNAEPFFPGVPARVSRFLSIFSTSGNSRGIAISEAVKDYCLSTREVQVKTPLDVVYYGFDPMKVSVDENNLPRKYTFGTVARLTPQKDLPTLFRAFKKYTGISNESKLLIIGSGTDAKKLNELCSQLELNDKVTWISKSHDVHADLKQIDTFVLPSLYEGFGLVLLEAMSAECAILAANNSAIPEVLGKQHTGLFETGSVESLVNLMIVAQSREFRSHLINYQNKRLKMFSPKVMESKIASIYNHLLQQQF
jgi:glycosyltransferase involved in cell wall biosynthesis